MRPLHGGMRRVNPVSFAFLLLRELAMRADDPFIRWDGKKLVVGDRRIKPSAVDWRLEDLPERITVLAHAVGIAAPQPVPLANLWWGLLRSRRRYRKNQLVALANGSDCAKAKEDDLTETWRLELHGRLEEAGLADRLSHREGRSQPSNKSSAPIDPSPIFVNWPREIMRSPEYSTLKAPLPALPDLSIDAGWVDLYLLRLADVERSLPLVDSPMSYVRRSETTHWIGDSVRHVVEGVRGMTVLIGHPGSGKSTLLAWVARWMIRDRESRFSLPILVPLRRYAIWRERHPGGMLLEYFLEQRGIGADPERKAWQELLREMARHNPDLVLLLLDGWDEVPGPNQSDLIGELAEVSATFRTVITSRPSGHPLRLPADRDCFYEIGQLPPDKIDELARNWFEGMNDINGEDRLMAYLNRYPDLQKLAMNPFLLSLLCAVVHRFGRHMADNLPRTRTELYRLAIEGIYEAYNAGVKKPRNQIARRERRQLQRLSLWLLAEADGAPRYWFEKADLPRAGMAEEAFKRKVLQTRLVTQMRLDYEVFQFLHATFQEYLASSALVGTVVIGRHAASLLYHPAWQEVLRFSAGLEGAAADAPLWKALKGIAMRPDRVGLIFLRLAYMLAEAKVRDGGQELVGLDLREELWEGLLTGVAPSQFADAAVALDAQDFSARLLRAIPHASGERRAMLIRCLTSLPPHLSSDEVTRMVLTGDSLDAAVASYTVRRVDRVTLDGFRRAALNLSSDVGVRMNAIETLGHAEDRGAIPTLIEIARGELSCPSSGDDALFLSAVRALGFIGGEGAARALLGLLDLTTDIRRQQDIVAALGQTNDPVGRNRLLVELAQRKPDNPLILDLLQSLNGVRIIRGGGVVREFLEPRYESEWRTAAIQALRESSFSQDPPVLGSLARDDKDTDVRLAALEVLITRAGKEQFDDLEWVATSSRPAGERTKALYALLEVVQRTKQSPGHAGFAERASSLVAKALDRPRGKLAQSAASGCWVLGERMLARLCELCQDEQAPLGIRTAACQSLGSLGSRHSGQIIRLLRSLLMGLGNTKGVGLPVGNLRADFYQAAADALARVEPDALLSLRDEYSKRALLKYSLTTGNPVFRRRIQRPDSHGRIQLTSEPTVGVQAIDLGIVIALQEEFDVFRERILRKAEDIRVEDDASTGRSYYLFRHRATRGGFRYKGAAVLIGDMNPTPAAMAASALIKKYSPKIMASVGISAGRRGEVRIGDVVVATQVKLYLDSGKATGDARTRRTTFLRGGKDYDCSADLFRIAGNLVNRDVYKAWQHNCTRRFGRLQPQEMCLQLYMDGVIGRPPSLTIGPVASGPLVVQSKEFLGWILEANRKIVAIDMESGGVLAAVKETGAPPRSLVIRGVSDFGEEDKGGLDAIGAGELRKYAMQNVLDILLVLLKEGWLPHAGTGS